MRRQKRLSPMRPGRFGREPHGWGLNSPIFDPIEPGPNDDSVLQACYLSSYYLICELELIDGQVTIRAMEAQEV